MTTVSSITDNVSIAQNVLRIEAAGLEKMANSMPASYNDVVELIFHTTGHVICTGIGKSGHIARKVAATLASTGTPSYFVHTAEANHGDLGMITKTDVVLAFSESGSNTELHGILDYTARLNIPLIAVTRQVNSQLGRWATHILLLPPAEPACPLRLAPTTVTTMMLGLGDALAVNLLQKRGFTSQHFKGFHPGGQLGKQLMSVTDLMHSGENIPIVSPKDIMQDVILEMTKKRLGCTAVVENGQLVGIITDGDLRRNISPDMLGKTAETIMHKNPKTITSSALATEAMMFMNRSQITTIFIVDKNHALCGILHMHDCLRAGLNKEE